MPWTWWDEKQSQENARAIMANNIARDPIGQKLSPEDRQSAIEFAVKIWKGNMGNGRAAELGIAHVTSK